MDLAHETNDLLMQVVEAVKKGDLTVEQVESKLRGESKKIRDLATILHSLLCFRVHKSSVISEGFADVGKCPFYAEDSLTDPWAQTNHVLWVQITDMLVHELELTPDQMIKDIAGINKLPSSGKIAQLYLLYIADKSIMIAAEKIKQAIEIGMLVQNSNKED